MKIARQASTPAFFIGMNSSLHASRRRRLALALLGIVALGGLFWRARSGGLPLEREFIPGPLGKERGLGKAEAAPGAFRTRSLGGVESTDQGAWARHNGLGAHLDFSHNLARVFPPALFERHPEYFPLEKGQRIKPPVGSGFWNPDLGRPDVARHAAEVAQLHFRRRPEAESFPLGVNDGLVFGESPDTLAFVTPLRWFRDRPDYSNLVFAFMNRAAADLARTHPDKYLGALAYYWAENAPDFPVHPQVVPYLTADRSQGYDASFKAEEKALQMRWGQAGPKRLGLYDYLYGQGFLIPRVTPQLIAENLRHARAAGFTDYYAEMTPNWGLDGPMPWLVAQLLLKPQQDERVLLDEYYRRYFQAAAGPMRKFFERAEAQWMRQPGPSYWLKHYRNESQASLFPSAVVGELRRVLDLATAAAQSERVRRRVRLVSVAFGVTERFVALQESREALNRLALGPPTDLGELARRLAKFLGARDEFTGYTRDLKAGEPLAIAPFVADDYLNHDPVANALSVLARGAVSFAPSADWRQTIEAIADKRVIEQWKDAVRLEQTGGREMQLNGRLEGPTQAARSLAGLTYGVDLPRPWQSKVEPAEHQRAVFVPGVEPPTLRIEGSKDTQVFQWVTMAESGGHVTRVQLRGRLSQSGVATLTLGWLDKNQRHLGVTMMRLPEGEWPDWVELTQGGRPPPGAHYVGIGIRVEHQAPGDWIEAREFSLRALPEEK
ncbi:MAG: DUF4838 domain-containing protein [Undibacterium sp.]|nr:DUF4838 domain-containing protein [Opitutaceae bacterium]